MFQLDHKGAYRRLGIYVPILSEWYHSTHPRQHFTWLWSTPWWTTFKPEFETRPLGTPERIRTQITEVGNRLPRAGARAACPVLKIHDSESPGWKPGDLPLFLTLDSWATDSPQRQDLAVGR